MEACTNALVITLAMAPEAIWGVEDIVMAAQS